MFCPACSKEIPDASTFCLHCGKPTTATPAPPPKKNVSSWALVLVAAVAVVTIIAVFYRYESARSPASPTSISTTRQTLVLVPVTKTIASGQLTIKAGHYLTYKITIDPVTMQNAQIVGSFRASGGAGNDIQVVLAGEDEFENWINGHKALVYYSTEKITNGRFDVPLTRPGTYILGLSNTFSTLSDKLVFVDIELRYQTTR